MYYYNESTAGADAIKFTLVQKVGNDKDTKFSSIKLMAAEVCSFFLILAAVLVF